MRFSRFVALWLVLYVVENVVGLLGRLFFFFLGGGGGEVSLAVLEVLAAIWLTRLCASSAQARRFVEHQPVATSMAIPFWLPAALQFFSCAAVSCVLRFNLVYWHLGILGNNISCLGTIIPKKFLK